MTTSYKSSLHPLAKIFLDEVTKPDSKFNFNKSFSSKDRKYPITTMLSLDTNTNSQVKSTSPNTDSNEHLYKDELDEYMYTFCTA